MIRVRVRGRAVTYDVRVERGLLARAGALVRPFATGSVVALVTDRTVARLYAARVERARAAGVLPARHAGSGGPRSKRVRVGHALRSKAAGPA